ncbi:MAG: hypothetical protein HYX67_17235 [Candidatus Melainabacteria bacterium]|nr:hypothetical protein [Candidatus Melainabacteria bacterium]
MQAEFNSVESPGLRPQAQLEQDKRSEHGLLTEAFGIAIDAASGKSTNKPQNEASKSHWGVAEFASGFVKAVPLFMGPGRGTVLSAVLYGLDEVHNGDDKATQLTDFALGGAKGAANKLVMDKFGSSEMSLVRKGIAIGGGSSFIDSALTRTNWIDQKTGEADIKAGLQKTAFQTAFGTAVGMAAFPLGHALGGKIAPSVQRLAGTSLDGNMVAAVTTGGAFGFTSGVVSETASQLYSGSFDPLAIAKRGVLEGLSTGAAGGVGHRFSAHYAFTHSETNSQFEPTDNLTKPARIGLTLAGGDRLEAGGAQHSVSDATADDVQSPSVQSPSMQSRIAFERDEAAIAAMPGNEIFPPRESVDTRTVPGSYAENGLWFPKTTLEGYSDAQVKEATSHLEDHYILGKPEIMADFLRRLQPVLDDWHNNNSEVLQKLSAEKESLALVGKLRGSHDKILGRVIGEIENKVPEFLVNELKESPTKLRDFLLSPSATILGVTKTRARAQKITELIEARTKYADDYKQTSALLNQRLPQIQQVADQFTREHNLAPVEVVSDSGAGPLGSYINGKIKLQREYFTGRNSPGLAGTFYHELLHHEQFSLMIRRLADKLDIGDAPTRSEQNRLKENYTFLLGKQLPEEYMNSILEVRNGERLTEQQAAVADTLVDTTPRLTEKNREAYRESGNAFRKINGLLNKLNGENGESMTSKIEQDAEDKSDLLATIAKFFPAVPPPKVSADALSPEQTRTNIIDGLKEWQIDINLWRMYDYTAYRGRKLEWDAWLLTSLTRNAVNTKAAESATAA